MNIKNAFPVMIALSLCCSCGITVAPPDTGKQEPVEAGKEQATCGVSHERVVPMDFQRSETEGDVVVTPGQEGVKVFFPKVSERNRWPGVVATLPRDCSRFTAVKVDCALTGGFSGNLAIRVDDTRGKKTFRYFQIDSKDRSALIMPIDGKRLDKTSMKQVNLYLSHPPHDAEFTFYGLSLINELPGKLAVLGEPFKGWGSTDSLRQRWQKLCVGIQDGTVLPDDGLRALAGLKEELNRNISRKVFAETRRLYGDVDFGVASSSCLTRVFPEIKYGIPGRTPEKLELSLARNESEMLQVLTIAQERELKNVRVTLSPFALKGKPSVILPAGKAAPVGLVTTTKSRVPNVRLGRYPDPILEFADVVPTVRANEIQSWVLRFHAEENTPAGVYEGQVTLSSDGGKAVIPMAVRVYDFTLPRRSSLVTATSVYGSKAMGKHKKAFGRWMLKNYRINPFSIYSDAAYGTPVTASMKEYLEAKEDGLNFIPMLYLKLPRQALHTHKGYTPQQSKAAWAAMTKEEKSTYPQEWKQKYLKLLRKIVPELKKAGLYDMAACYGFDEAGADEWPAIVDLMKTLKGEFPDLRVVSTLYDASYGEKSILGGWIDGWIPYLSGYRYQAAENARKKGREVWYYTVKMTVDGEELADIRCQLGSCAFANKVDGWLVWTVSRWCDNKPITTVPDTDWEPESFPGDNGGGSYFCMGPKGQFLPTLRAEAIRDGIEDYEYLAMVRKRASALPEDTPLRKRADKLLGGLSRDLVSTITVQQAIRTEAAALLEAMGAGAR